MTARHLVADVGGTNARFARATPGGRLRQLRSFAATDFATFSEALRHYLGSVGLPACDSLSIAAAGPVVDRRVQLTNLPWLIDAPALSREIGGCEVRLLNDLEAVALAIPALGDADLEAVGPPGRAPERAARLVLNVGTGFGAATLVATGEGGWLALPGEPGHMTLEPGDPAELGLGAATPWRDLTVEGLLSGDGVVRAYRLLSGGVEGDPPTTAAEVFERVASDPAAAGTVSLVTRLLARVAANLVLASCAWGGLFLTGGVVAGLRALLDWERFRRTFEASPRMGARLVEVPISVILHEQAALLGLARR